MRRFIRLPVKKTRLYPGNALCQNIQCLTPIQMAMLQFEQCMAQHTTRHNLTSEYKKNVCPQQKNRHFCCIIYFAVAEQLFSLQYQNNL